MVIRELKLLTYGLIILDQYSILMDGNQELNVLTEIKTAITTSNQEDMQQKKQQEL